MPYAWWIRQQSLSPKGGAHVNLLFCTCQYIQLYLILEPSILTKQQLGVDRFGFHLKGVDEQVDEARLQSHEGRGHGVVAASHGRREKLDW